MTNNGKCISAWLVANRKEIGMVALLKLLWIGFAYRAELWTFVSTYWPLIGLFHMYIVYGWRGVNEYRKSANRGVPIRYWNYD